ncbi:MAG TPA: PRC-barrel domain-containing protein [Longimicrobiales bacterium]|nr:PRC-barrel domain-containing protein [Longimicrobiales bacterium]
MARKKRGPTRDAAGVGPDPTASRRRLIPLDDLTGYTMAAGEPDIRGWDVRTLGGRELGEVEDLLVDPDRGEVVMLEVDVRGEGTHAEVPLRAVQLDRARKVVLVDSGELETRNDVRARERLDVVERERVRDTYRNATRDVRYGTSDEAARREDGVDEVVVERRPVVEEVVVRRRIVEAKSD